MAKATFVLDDDTIQEIRRLAQRKRKPQSFVVREAIAAYGKQEDKLTDAERTRRLNVLNRLGVQPATRAASEVDDELRALRRGRRTGWRRATD